LIDLEITKRKMLSTSIQTLNRRFSCRSTTVFTNLKRSNNVTILCIQKAWLSDGGDGSTWSHRRDSFLKAVQSKTGVAAIGGSVILGGMGYTFYRITHGFLMLTPLSSFYYGFSGGIFTGCTIGVLAVIVDRALYIRPENAIRSARYLIFKNPDLVRELGGTPSNSPAGTHSVITEFKAFKSNAGGFTVINSRLSWQRPEVQVVFGIHGAKSDVEAIATVICSKNGLFEENVDFFGVDVTTSVKGAPKISRILVKGSQSMFTKHDESKKLVSFYPRSIG
jgi:hypothetical protein